MAILSLPFSAPRDFAAKVLFAYIEAQARQLLKLFSMNLLDACVVAAVHALVIVIEDPHLTVLEVDPHVAEAPRHLGPALLHDYAHAPPSVSLMVHVIADP